MAALTIGQVAARAGLNTSHIRYYERVGVLPKPERASGQRRYDDEVLHRLAIIGVAQRAGFTLDEIRDLTGPENRGSARGRAHPRAGRPQAARRGGADRTRRGGEGVARAGSLL